MRILTIILLLTSLCSYSQTVSNITTKQIGDKIEVNYVINESSADQKFTVTISCLVNKKEKIVLSNVTGDVGADVPGGKSSYVATWDVLKDVETLNSATFYVKIEKQKENKTKKISNQEHPWYIMYNGGLIYTLGGVRIGYADNWGGYVGFRIGSGYFGSSLDGFTVTENETSTISLTAGISKRLVDNKSFSLNGYAGVGVGVWGDYDYYSFDENLNEVNYYGNDDFGFEVEYGILTSIKRFSFALGLAHNIGYSANTDFVLGVGFKL